MPPGLWSYLSRYAVAGCWRLLFFAGLWLLICGGRLASWPFGLPALLLATWLHLRLGQGAAVHLHPLLVVRFIPFFVQKSLLSGFDVMRRVLHPRLPIDPALINYRLNIGHTSGRVLLANCITLLPGTISTRLSGDVVVVHTLDKRLAVHDTIHDLEQRIATMITRIPTGQEARREL